MPQPQCGQLSEFAIRMVRTMHSTDVVEADLPFDILRYGILQDVTVTALSQLHQLTAVRVVDLNRCTSHARQHMHGAYAYVWSRWAADGLSA